MGFLSNLTDPNGSIAAEKQQAGHKFRHGCPKCGSRNILDNGSKGLRASKKVAAGVVFLPLAFVVGRKKVQVSECFDCGARWMAK